MRVLHREAIERGGMQDFVAAVTRTLAWTAFAYDSHGITADILRRIGAQLEEFAERERAEREPGALRKAGGEAN